MSQLHECRRIVSTTKLGGIPVSQLLKRPDFSYLDLPTDIRSVAPPEIWELIESDTKYEGYAIRQNQHNSQMFKRYAQAIPDGIDFSAVVGLSSETRQKLSKVRPTTLGQATRISGVTPADISILSIWLMKNNLCKQNQPVDSTEAN